jgi:hypothetical protein
MLPLIERVQVEVQRSFELPMVERAVAFGGLGRVGCRRGSCDNFVVPHREERVPGRDRREPIVFVLSGKIGFVMYRRVNRFAASRGHGATQNREAKSQGDGVQRVFHDDFPRLLPEPRSSMQRTRDCYK